MEFSKSVDHQPRLPSQIEAFITAHAQDLPCNGTVVISWRVRGGQKRGPYYRLTCRGTEGRQSSVYVPSKFVEQVRTKLAEIRNPRRQHRRLEKARGHLRAVAAQAKRDVDRHLVPLGLYRKGSEIRGWSTASLGNLDTSSTDIGRTEKLFDS